jgi:hypothetical protein
LSVLLKNQKQDQSRLNVAAKAEVAQVKKDVSRHNKPVQRGIKSILSKDWNIEHPSRHGGGILGNECQKVMMSLMRLLLDQIKEFSLQRLKKNRGSAGAKREVKKRCDIVAKASLLFDRLLSLLRTPHKKDLTLGKVLKPRRCAKKAVEVWPTLQLSAAPKCQGSEHHAWDQVEFPWGLAKFCEDWVEQLHQLGLKNNQQTETIRQPQRPKVQTAHSLGAVKWKKECRRQRRKCQGNRSGSFRMVTQAKKQQELSWLQRVFITKQLF